MPSEPMRQKPLAQSFAVWHAAPVTWRAPLLTRIDRHTCSRDVPRGRAPASLLHGAGLLSAHRHSLTFPPLQRMPRRSGVSELRRLLRSTTSTVPPLYWRSKSELAT